MRNVVLGEHQSTINNNIPIRLLMYVGRTYEQLLSGHRKYETELIEIPTPEFYVFYNGKAAWDVKELRLSDAFKNKSNPFNLELKVTLINIRAGSSHTVLKKCEILNQYSKFVQVYESNKGKSDRMEDTIKYCLEHNILSEYIQRKGKEVISMLTADWDVNEAMEVAREEGTAIGMEEGRKKGMEEGRKKGREEDIINFYKVGCSLIMIATATGKSEYEIKQILTNNGVNLDH